MNDVTVEVMEHKKFILIDLNFLIITLLSEKKTKKIKGNKRFQLKDLNNIHNNVDLCFFEVKKYGG